MKKRNLLSAMSVLPSVAASAGETFLREPPEKYWDFDVLKKAPPFRDAPFSDSSSDGLRAVLVTGYGGTVPIGKKPTLVRKQTPLSEKVKAEFFAYIGIPSGPVPKGGFPGIVLIHGGGGTAYASYTKHWVAQGYAVIALDWYNQRPVQEGKGQVPLPGGKRQDHVANVANMILCHSLLRSLDEVDPEKTAFVGLSWGSWYGAMVAAVDDRFKGGVEIYCGDVKSRSNAFINGRFHHAAKIPLYWVGGTNDRNVTPETLEAAFEECPKLENKSMVIRLPHSHVGFLFDSCSRMAAHFTQGKPGLPKLSDITQKGNRVSAKILDPGMGIQYAELCYTDSREKVCYKRLWNRMPAKIEGDTVSAELPPGAYQFFLSAYERKSQYDDLCGSTSIVILPPSRPAQKAAVSKEGKAVKKTPAARQGKQGAQK